MRETGRPGPVQQSGGSRLFLGVVLAGSLALIGTGLYGFFRNPGGLEPLQAAERPLPAAPHFSLPDLEGRSRSLAEFLGKKPVLLEFMDLDCPHCLEMAPILTRLHDAYGTRVQFLTVAFDSRRNTRRVRAFAEHHRHGWPYLMGSQDVVRVYGLEGVPAFFLVTRDGRIAGFQVGSTSYEAMSRGIESVLVGP
jgi:thiol-disulfide isomerase/thioredoxin